MLQVAHLSKYGVPVSIQGSVLVVQGCSSVSDIAFPTFCFLLGSWASFSSSVFFLLCQCTWRLIYQFVMLFDLSMKRELEKGMSWRT